VNAYNVRMQQMPDTLMASMMHLAPRPMFKAAESDRAPLAMDFTAAQGS
jgi:hypothetical protein